MKSLLCLALLAAALAPPKQKVRVGVIAADSATVTLQATVTLAGTLRATDAIRFNWFRDNVLTASKDTTTLTYAQVLPSPACGQTSTYYVVTKMLYAGVVDSRNVKSNVISYTAPSCPVPPPTIQGVDITPTSVSLAPGQSVQFAAVTR